MTHRRYHIMITECTKRGKTKTILDQEFDLMDAEYTVEPVETLFDDAGNYLQDGILRYEPGDYAVRVYARGIQHPAPRKKKRRCEG